VHKGWALTLLVTVQFMLILDASIVTVALPAIHSQFHVASQSTLSWVANGYLLTFGGLLLLGGRLGDRFGRRRLFFIGTTIFGIATLGTGLAQSFGFLVAARFVQGAGAAMVAPAALGLLTVIFTDGDERNKALGIWGAVSGTGGAAGLILGGVLTTGINWRWVFFVNIPIVVAALIFTPKLLPEASGESTAGSFDVPGATAVVLGVSSLVYGFVEAGNKSWGSPNSWAFIGAGVVLLLGFVGIELRSSSPLVRFSLFRSRSILGANLGMLAFGMASFGIWFYLALYLQEVHSYSALKAGVASLPLNVALIATATMSSKWVSRFGPKPVTAVGMVIVTGGLAWFHFITPTGSYVGVTLGPIIVMGLGMGLAYVGLTVGAVSGVAPHEAGLASGLLNTTTQVGTAIGLAILTAISTTQTAHALGRGASEHVALTQGFRDALVVGGSFTLAAVFIVLFVLSNRENRAFVEMVRGSGAPFEEALDVLASADSVAGLGAESFETALRTRDAQETNAGPQGQQPVRSRGDAA
jgi:EmrB/QacA subfamily drug resistance transporter